jgi:choline dehydrogenase-like flavoprotein
MKIAIVGSGPSGWATTKKLIELGHEVTVIDAGLVEGDSFAHETDGAIGLSRKLYFGSDLPYRSYPHGPLTEKRNVNPISSFARGGLSLVWGATMLPYCKEDTKKWPVEISKLDGEFTEISNLLPITGIDDQLNSLYGRFISRRGIIPSARILRFIELCDRNKQPGVTVGLSRLAVETGSTKVSGCIYCNKCIDGCPGDFIWSSRLSIKEAGYLKMRVTKLIEEKASVKIEGFRIDGSYITTQDFAKVFLACGPVESFRILANSKITGKDAVLKDSSTFFLPMFVLPRLGSAKSNSFALSQCFIRLNVGAENHASQFQVYEYSEDLILRVRKVLPFGRIVPRWFLKLGLKRIVVAIGYLGEEQSPAIQMQFLEDGSVSLIHFSEGVTLNQRRQFIKETIKQLAKFTSKKGLVPLKFLTQIALPGEGVHSGAWLPMGQKSDLLGRPFSSKNIHVVDSSILPSIAPGPITFTVMANAMRIARESVQ